MTMPELSEQALSGAHALIFSTTGLVRDSRAQISISHSSAHSRNRHPLDSPATLPASFDAQCSPTYLPCGSSFRASFFRDVPNLALFYRLNTNEHKQCLFYRKIAFRCCLAVF